MRLEPGCRSSLDTPCDADRSRRRGGSGGGVGDVRMRGFTADEEDWFSLTAIVWSCSAGTVADRVVCELSVLAAPPSISARSDKTVCFGRRSGSAFSVDAPSASISQTRADKFGQRKMRERNYRGSRVVGWRLALFSLKWHRRRNQRSRQSQRTRERRRLHR